MSGDAGRDTPTPEPPIPGIEPGREPRWGLGDAVLGFVVANASALVIGGLILAVTGNLDPGDVDRLSLGMLAVLQVPLWLGYVAVPIIATRRKGNGPVADLRIRIEARDVPKGLAIGVLTQLVLVPLLYVPIFLWGDIDREKLSEPARDLTDRAAGPVDSLLLLIIVGVGAPIAEEIFFRGLLQRALLRRFAPWLGIGIGAVVFSAAHQQVLQFPALVLFGVVAGVLAHRSGRLGPAVAMHIGFNVTTVLLLLAQDGVDAMLGGPG